MNKKMLFGFLALLVGFSALASAEWVRLEGEGAYSAWNYGETGYARMWANDGENTAFLDSSSGWMDGVLIGKYGENFNIESSENLKVVYGENVIRFSGTGNIKVIGGNFVIRVFAKGTNIHGTGNGGVYAEGDSGNCKGFAGIGIWKEHDCRPQ